jgi:nucleoside-diphosphate-sugar epimerase
LGKSRLRDISIAHLLVENAVLGRILQVPPVDYHANFVYVKDIARAYLLAAQAPPTEHLIFNVGGFVYQNSEAVEVLKKLLPGLTVHQQDEYTLSHPIEVFAQDQSRASDEFGYEPVYTLEEGVKDYIKMFEEMGEQYKSAWSAYEVTPLP